MLAVLVEDNIVMQDLQGLQIVDRGAMTLPVIQHKQPSSAFMTTATFQLIAETMSTSSSAGREILSPRISGQGQ